MAVTNKFKVASEVSGKNLFSSSTVDASNQHEFQYQTYLEDKLKPKPMIKPSPNRILSKLSAFYSPHEIIFLNGSPRCRTFCTRAQGRKCRWIINNQFHFAKRVFQIWLTKYVFSADSGKSVCVSSRWKKCSILMLSQQQSLTFKFFLPPI